MWLHTKQDKTELFNVDFLNYQKLPLRYYAIVNKPLEILVSFFQSFSNCEWFPYLTFLLQESYVIANKELCGINTESAFKAEDSRQQIPTHVIYYEEC